MNKNRGAVLNGQLPSFIRVMFLILANSYWACGVLIYKPPVKFLTEGGTNKDNPILSMYFVFGTMVLYSISLFMPPLRKLKNPWMGAFLLWSLAMLFLHNFVIRPDSITSRYMNFYLMSEGFLYVLTTVLLFKTLYEHCQKSAYLYAGLWMATGVFLAQSALRPSFSFWTSASVVTFIYLLLRKKYVVIFCALIVIATMAFNLWPDISNKLRTRPYSMAYVLTEIKQSPITGHGFDTSLLSNFYLGHYGWTYRNNDYLNIARDLGVPALVLIAGFLWTFFRRVKRFDLLAACCAVFLLTAAYQTTFYHFKNMFVFAPLMAVLAVRNDLWQTL